MCPARSSCCGGAPSLAGIGRRSVLSCSTFRGRGLAAAAPTAAITASPIFSRVGVRGEPPDTLGASVDGVLCFSTLVGNDALDLRRRSAALEFRGEKSAQNGLGQFGADHARAHGDYLGVIAHPGALSRIRIMALGGANALHLVRG